MVLGVRYNDVDMDRRQRDKIADQRAMFRNNDLEPVHGPVYRRRRPSKTRRMMRMKARELEQNEDMEEVETSPKSKSKQHLRKEIERLMEENQRLAVKLEKYKRHSGTDEIKERDLALSKVQSRYEKLEKDHETVLQECEKLGHILEQREMQFRQLHAHRDELVQKLQQTEEARSELLASNQKVETERVQLSEDILLLKHVVYQLNAELERYQNKLRESCKDTSSKTVLDPSDNPKSINHAAVAQSWGSVKTHALGPLLNAYQESITEKEELLKKYQDEISDLSDRCKDIVAENELLHKQVAEITLKSNRYEEEIKTLAEDAVLVKEQNDLLTKQSAQQKQKLQEIHALYERKVESMSQDNNKLHKDYVSCKTELSNLLGKYEILNESYEKLKNDTEKTVPLCVHTAAVQECKTLFEELKSQYEADRKKLSTQVKQLEESRQENEKEFVTAVTERNQLKILTKTLEKNLKRTQSKLDHVQSIMYSMQISRDSFKRELNKTTSYCKELMSEYEKLLIEKERLIGLLHQKEKEDVQIRYLGDTISQRMGNLRSQLKSVQKGAKEQLATVERRIRTQESGVHQMKAEYNQEVQRLKNLLRQKEGIIGQLQKEKFSTQDNLDLVWRAATTDEKKVKNALRASKIHDV